MRVIAGEFRSRKLKSVPGMATRPTPDRLRETLFDVIAPVVPGSTFLDAYAGSGAVGIEALSRGAERAILIERSRDAAGIIRDNLAALGLDARAEVICGKVLVALARLKADIVFMDPPYEMQREYTQALGILAAAPPQLTVVQHSTRLSLGEEYGPLQRYRTIKQGDNALSFYR